MTRRLLIFLFWLFCAAIVWFAPAKAQAPGCATISPNCVQFGAFLPSGIASINATSVSANIAFPSLGSTLLAVLTNQGPVQVNVLAGNSSVTVSALSGTPLAPGQSICIAQGLNTNIAAVTGSQAAVIAVQSGSGACPLPGMIATPPLLITHTSVAAAGLVAKVGAGILRGWSAVNGNTQGWLLIFDAAGAPGDGTVGAALLACIPINAAQMIAETIPGPGIAFSDGLVLMLSSTGCFDLLAQTGVGNLGFLSAQVQ